MSFSSTIAMQIRTMVVMTIILEQQASVSCIDHDIRSEIFTAPNGNIMNTFAQLMARREHLYQTVQRQKPQKMSQQIYEKTQTTRGRVLLSSEREQGIERSSIIVMPIDQPKVLTSENFVTGRSQRVYGESKNGKGPFSATLNPSDVAEELTMTERAQVETEEVSNTGTNGRIFPAEYWQLPPALLAARLRRFSKANIMRSLRQNARRMGINGDKLRALMRHIDTMRREQAQRRNHRNDQLLNRKKHVPPIYFLIDDESYHRTVSAIDDEKPQLNRRFVTKANLRTKFQNERSTKPITVEETDLDLLSPKISVGGTESKPYSELYNHGQTQLSLQSLSNISSQQPLPAQVNAVPSNGLGISTSLNARHPLPSAQRLPQIITASTMSPHLATVSNVVTVPPLMTPNVKLELCCRRQQLPSTCQQFCNFDTFTQEKLLIALLGTHCPSAQLSKAFDCATSKVDHSECCRQAGIDRIHNGQCMVFCRTHTKTPPNVSGYVSCLSVFGTIKNCYRDHQIKHKNLFGD